MKIGELANSVNCHVETVRYYEKEGLLPPARRLANGYGDYSNTHLALLRLIRRSKELGFRQQHIRELVKLTDHSNKSCAEVHQLTLTQWDSVKRKIKELRKIERALKTLASACETNTLANCPVLLELIGSE